MSKPHRNRTNDGRNARVMMRPGDHYFVNTVVDTEVSTSGATTKELGIEIGSAPVPERRFSADVCYLSVRPTGFKLVFGQTLLATDKLKAAVVVNMSRRGVAHMLQAVAEIKNPSFDEIATREGIVPEFVGPLAHEPEQVVCLSANLALSAMSGEESVVDFLQLSPFSLAMAQKGASQTPIDPVVRIDLHSAYFLGLRDALRSQLKIAAPLARTDRP